MPSLACTLSRIVLVLLLACGSAQAQIQLTGQPQLSLGGAGSPAVSYTAKPFWVLSPSAVTATIDLDFANGRYWQSPIQGTNPAAFITVSRASSGTNLLPISASGPAYSTFGVNVARITVGSGLLVEEARTNQLLNSTVPVTQTTGSLAATAQTLWVNGSGSAILSNGSATGCAGTATNGSVVTFTPTAGTCTVTVSGSLNAFQLEAGSFGTSLIVTAGVTASRAADVVTLTNVPVFGNTNTMFAASMWPVLPTSGNPRALSLSDGTGNNREELYTNSAVGHNINVYNGGANQWDTTAGGTITAGVTEKWAQALAPSSFATAYNGTAGLTQASGTPPSSALTQVHIGGAFDGSVQNARYISRIDLWPTTRLPNASLQQVTR